MKNALNRNIPPAARPLSNVKLKPFTRYNLSNGIPVYLLPCGSVDVVEVQTIFKAGKGYQEKVGQAQFTARNLQEGTERLSSLELARELDGLGAWMSNDTGESFLTVNLATTTENLPYSLPLMREVIVAPTFPEGEFNNMKQRTLQKLSVSEKQTSYLARRHFRHLMFGQDHAYGIHFGSRELLQIERQDLLNYQATYLQPGNFCFSVVGKFEEQQVMDQLEKTFGNLVLQAPNIAVSSASLTPPPSLAGRHYFEQEGMQATVRLGQRAFARSHPDYYGMSVVNTIFGGYFGSRLMKNIREEKGYTYGIYSSWASFRFDGMLIIQTDVGNEYIEPTINEIKSEMHKLMTEGVTMDELELVKNYLLGRSISYRETPFQLGDILRESIANEITFEEMDREFEVIQQITPEEIQALAQRYYQPDNLLEVVVGKM